ncbi:MAG: glycosyltransferase family protein [Firmicutes bacterium]|jgi:spore coat polysaccharide biosynthesis protein SpsF|nr:glycosyltransferase family protein [Bacillota bacterium]
MKKGIIVQARTGSSRLPNKVMMELDDKKVLAHVLERLSQVENADVVIIATTEKESDDVIFEFCKKRAVPCFRGSEDDVLSRYYGAAKEHKLDVVVRITSDCPLIDPKIIDEMLGRYEEGILTTGNSDLSTRTFPRGMDTEIFKFEYLKDAFNNASEKYQREHVTPYIYENYENIIFSNEVDYSKYRLTLDTKEDFQLIRAVYEILYSGYHDFYLAEIIDVMEKNPEFYQINCMIEQKKVK